MKHAQRTEKYIRLIFNSYISDGDFFKSPWVLQTRNNFFLEIFKDKRRCALCTNAHYTTLNTVCGFRYYQICFYICMCMYMHVDFDIIKFASTYMCMYMNVDFDNIIFVSTDIYVCGFRYDQIRFYIYMCMCMYVDFDIIKFVSTYTICICVYTCMWISI